MKLRWARAILLGMLLLQTGLLAPAAMALGMAQSMADCAGQQGTADSNCPCCPHGMLTHAGCASNCLGTFAVLPEPFQLMPDAALRVHLNSPTSQHSSQIYTPANPPPIG